MDGVGTFRALVLAQQGPAAAEGALPPAATGYGVQLVQSLLALAAVCVVAWWVLRWAARRGLGRAPQGRNIRVLERVSLDGQKSLYLVEVGKRMLLIGSSEHALSTLAELRADEIARTTELSQPAPVVRFSDVLKRLRGDDTGPRAGAGTSSNRNPGTDSSAGSAAGKDNVAAPAVGSRREGKNDEEVL